MADILKVTTPTSGYENSTRTNPIRSNDPNIQNIVDPTRVGRSDGKAGYSDNTENKFGLNYESNFDLFLQMVKNSSHLNELMTDILFAKMEMWVTSGMNPDFATEVAKFMELLKMTDAQLVHFLKNQSAGAVRFKGAFFEILRQAMAETTSSGFQTNVLDFLKKYNDMASGQHILKGIFQSLDGIARSIPARFADSLRELTQQLSPDAKNGDTLQNGKVLKDSILPFLSSYVGKTYDMGKARNFITMLTQQIARYENSSKEGFLQSFQQLMGYQIMQQKLNGMDSDQLQLILSQTEFEKAGTQNGLVDQLLTMMEHGIRGEAGYETKEVFENIMQGLLMNESVYLPLLHIMVPVELQGGLLFSELWVDPEDGKETQPDGSEEKRIKLFVKFDLKSVGYFELILTSCHKTVDLQLFYPAFMEPMEKEMKQGISHIIEKNGLQFRTFSLGKGERPLAISEVFPKLQERKNTINVKI